MVAASRAGLAIAVLALGLAPGCTTAGAREQEFVRQNIATILLVEDVRVSCEDALLFAGSDVCATVAMSEGSVLQFRGLGYQSFGPVPSRVRLVAAGGRSPLVVSCESQSGYADVERGGLFGHHFSPAIDDVAHAIRRRREVIEELEFWPQCPQFWELAGEQGTTYRYCAHAAGAVAEPPPRPCQQTLDSTK